MADYGRVGVALDVGAPLPARGVGVARTDVLGLEALQLLLVAELVGLGRMQVSGKNSAVMGSRAKYHSLGVVNGVMLV